MDKSNGDGLLGTKLSDCVYRWFGHAMPTCGSLSSRETSPLYEWPTIRSTGPTRPRSQTIECFAAIGSDEPSPDAAQGDILIRTNT